ncbi:hypothetical protein 587AP1_49 [Mannheimia phage vB_MhM_587AP1]|uniref:Uncharacterized protein n=4 Tax=Baylorvirus TaxID=2732973 RepID=R9QBT9_9CAUD|nr:hypothetical protein AVV63_gp49 [Mannheimia phage vB_MhM_587AP1]AFL46498.1 hypothetical protein 1152AP_0051 [Mannheimia phage vB_MhM_1152AP]AGK02349.1 hypothetical protein MHH_c19010 [Mannheimia haemolytica M42548]AJA72922.1 hypothetical protein 535AP1_49 [Mannheimia phage vB_MhM_535AP1]AJA73154.1 hypothetical protein 2256AP1_50 [Mannheimia phage vB_MhM_2256AP1]AJA72973.1 hypothetical protein 587AP1_49 [Mannheimia phage vB_MhM_587AP1]
MKFIGFCILKYFTNNRYYPSLQMPANAFCYVYRFYAHR